MCNWLFEINALRFPKTVCNYNQHCFSSHLYISYVPEGMSTLG
jgi:hypothetical protein